MRLIASLLFLSCIVSLALGQWIETTIRLPDSTSKLDSIRIMQYHSPNRTVYVGGKHKLVAVDALTHRFLAWITLPDSPPPMDIVCSSTASNRLYCAPLSRESVWVVDCATNGPLKPVPLRARVQAMCYAAGPNKVYAACPPDSVVDVIDCATDSVVAIKVLSWPSALCYNPELNRIYVTKSTSDEVAVIDCGADTVISTIWVRGVEPTAIGYDSATNCVYTLNYTSATSSIIDCASDTVIRVVPVDAKPDRVVVGPDGKVYCGGYDDSVVTVVEPHGTRTVPVGLHLSSMSFDPISRKVSCALSDSDVVVIDAVGDTVVARVRAGEDLRLVCYDPVDTSTWATSADGAMVGIIDDGTDLLIDALLFGSFAPRNLCYNPANDRLYCLGRGLAVIACDSNQVVGILPVGGTADSMIRNPVNNRLYFSSPAENTVSILDCASDTIMATVEAGQSPDAMCCSADGKVYVTIGGGVAVIDPDGDSVRKVVPTPYDPKTLCYDRTDNRVYAGLDSGRLVSVIDVVRDSVLKNVPVSVSCDKVCWNQNHDKVYVSGSSDTSVVVIDCAGDTVRSSLSVQTFAPLTTYSDSASDRVFVSDGDLLYAINPAADTLNGGVGVGHVAGIVDNGQSGGANRLYCAETGNRELCVTNGTGDAIIRRVPMGVNSTVLAWNPAHWWVYALDPYSPSIVVVSDTMLGIEETEPRVQSHKLEATIVRGVLVLDAVYSRQKTGYSAELLNITGRKVMDLSTGANVVRALAPGVYFVREAQAQAQAQAVRKVVVMR
ncbi:MAG TPA: YncE family protein [bacterium]|nr:YncE family protein [bacterium]